MKNRKTALVLSGGGSRGAYQIGVWQALRELGIEIDIVCGTSVGAINGAVITQDAFDLAASLWKTIEAEMIFDITVDENYNLPKLDFAGLSAEEALAYAKEIFGKGGADSSRLKEFLLQYVDEEVIRSRKTEFCLTTVELPFLKPHRACLEDIPQGRLVDYLMASSAIIPALKPYEIDGKIFIDGGWGDVMPIRSALDRGATHIIAVDLRSPGILHKGDIEQAKKTAHLKILSPLHNLGNIMSFETENTARNMRLGYLEAMKAFGVFKGFRYTFAGGAIPTSELKKADAACAIFELDPTILYTADVFHDLLTDKVIDAVKETRPGNLSNPLDAVADIISGLSKLTNRKAFTLHLVFALKKGVHGPAFLKAKRAAKLFREEIAAAQYIAKMPFSDLLFEAEK